MNEGIELNLLIRGERALLCKAGQVVHSRDVLRPELDRDEEFHRGGREVRGPQIQQP